MTELLVIFGLALFNGFFAAAEISVLSVRRTRLTELASEGKRAAAIALRLRREPENFLATVQVGITVIGATAGAFGGATLEQPLAHWLARLGITKATEQRASLWSARRPPCRRSIVGSGSIFPSRRSTPRCRVC
jgi:putative hemolysin